MAFHAVRAYTEDGDVLLRVFRVFVTERGGFDCSTRRVVPHVEPQDDLLPTIILQRYPLASIVGESEIRRTLAFFDHVFLPEDLTASARECGARGVPVSVSVGERLRAPSELADWKRILGETNETPLVPLTPSEVALIFDLDNTLIDSHIDFLGLRHRLIDLLYKEGTSTHTTRDELVRLALPELVSLGSQVNPGLADRMWQIIGLAERQGLEHATVIPGAPEVVRSLSERGYQLALLTNNARAGVGDRLRSLELDRYFKVIATRDDVPSLKPRPGGIVYIVNRLARVSRFYLIGDAWIDAQAARDAGARFIGFGTKEASVRDRGLPVWVWIQDLRELLTLDL